MFVTIQPGEGFWLKSNGLPLGIFGGEESVIHFPTEMQAHTDTVIIDSKVPAKVGEASRHAFDGLPSRCSFIVGLLKVGGPFHVTRFIVSVVIDAMDTVVFRTLAKIRQKIVKILPAVTHFNTTTAIIWIFFEVLIMTSSNHGSPYSISKRELRSPPGVSMFEAFLFRAGTAGDGLASAEVGASDYFFNPAFTPANHSLKWVSCLGNERFSDPGNGEFSEHLPDPFLLVNGVYSDWIYGGFLYDRRLGACLEVGHAGFDPLTTARRGMPTEEFLVLGDDLLAAGTSADAHSESFTVGSEIWCGITDYCELAKGEVLDVNSWRHNDGSFIVMFSSGSRLQPCLAATSDSFINPVSAQRERSLHAVVLS